MSSDSSRSPAYLAGRWDVETAYHDGHERTPRTAVVYASLLRHGRWRGRDMARADRCVCALPHKKCTLCVLCVTVRRHDPDQIAVPTHIYG